MFFFLHFLFPFSHLFCIPSGTQVAHLIHYTDKNRYVYTQSRPEYNLYRFQRCNGYQQRTFPQNIEICQSWSKGKKLEQQEIYHLHRIPKKNQSKLRPAQIHKSVDIRGNVVWISVVIICHCQIAGVVNCKKLPISCPDGGYLLYQHKLRA